MLTKLQRHIVQGQHFTFMFPLQHLKQREPLFGCRQFKRRLSGLLFVGKQTPVDKIGRHTVLAPKIEIPNRCLQRGGDYLRLSLGHSQQHGEGHILQVIAVGHLGSTAYRFFTLAGFGDQQTLPDILIVIATPHHMKITQ